METCFPPRSQGTWAGGYVAASPTSPALAMAVCSVLWECLRAPGCSAVAPGRPPTCQSRSG